LTKRKCKRNAKRCLSKFKTQFLRNYFDCFCYVSPLFYFCRLREEEKQKQRKKKEGLSSMSGEQLPFNHWLLLFPPPTTSLPLPFLLLLLHSPLFMLHVNSEEQLITGLCRFHCQSLLLLFPFFFSFIFCILHCSREQ